MPRDGSIELAKVRKAILHHSVHLTRLKKREAEIVAKQTRKQRAVIEQAESFKQQLRASYLTLNDAELFDAAQEHDVRWDNDEPREEIVDAIIAVRFS